MKKVEKKITRGISKTFADAFKKNDLYKLYEEHKDELFIGVRNNYLNLYYDCDSIAKITYSRGVIHCKIDKYYLDGIHYTGKEKRIKIEPNQIVARYEEIKKNSNSKASYEKKAQSKLVLLNNNNSSSNWYCIDVEYCKQFKNNEEKAKAGFNARFDIIALSKEKPHRVALIELKYGSKSIGGNSGVYKHVKDFKMFQEKRYFDSHLKQEIIDIVESLRYLETTIPFETSLEKENILSPEFYFITLDNNAETENASTPRQTMSGYLFNDGRWSCRRLSSKRVQPTFGDITKKDNEFYAIFKFSKATLENLNITDIIDGDYQEFIDE
ncbi:hypothetical protein LJB92_03705 [Bacteroidales bacterium OttesenSCG-928-M06]|nr:hypothetical protein [Bacteroidales bacterium OttesenSCG-928-M06]